MYHRTHVVELQVRCFIGRCTTGSFGHIGTYGLDLSSQGLANCGQEYEGKKQREVAFHKRLSLCHQNKQNSRNNFRKVVSKSEKSMQNAQFRMQNCEPRLLSRKTGAEIDQEAE